MQALKKAILPGALLLALVALVVRLDAGIWDPWEMNRAHVARQLAGRPKVLVVELGSRLNESLEARWGEHAFFVGAQGGEGPAPAATPAAEANRPGAAGRLFKQAGDLLGSEVFHAVFVEAGAVTEQPLKGIGFLEEMRSESPGARHLLVAESDEACAAAVRALEKAMALEAANLLQSGYRLLPADEDVEALAAERAGSYPFVLGMGCVAEESDALAANLDDLGWIKWTRVQFKGTTNPGAKKDAKGDLATYSVPPLDHWITALSYKVFGFSETSSRLPSVLFGLLTLLLVAWGAARLFGNETAAISVLLLMAVPHFFGQAKNMSGEMSYTFFLTGAVVAFGLLVREGFSAGRFVGLLAAALALFAAKGLFALGLVVLLLVVYLLLARDFRFKPVLLPAGVLLLLFAGLTVLVQLPSEWTFFEHFKFMNKAFAGAMVEERRTFEFFVRHVSFAIMPWTLLLPFAIARLVPVFDRTEWTGEQRLELLVFLWFVIPFALHSAVMPGFLHTVFPAVTAVAVAVALLWRADGAEQTSRFRAVVILGIAAVILANLFKSPQHLLSFLTLDPEMGGEEGGMAFPPDFATPLAVKALLGLTALLLAAYYGRGGSIFREVVAFFRRPVPFWAALWTLATLFVARLVAGMGNRYLTALTDKNAGKLRPEYVEFYQELFTMRIESVLIYIGLGCLALAALLRYTRVGRWCARGLRLLAPVGRLLRGAQGWVARDWIGLAAALALAGAALVDLLVTFDFPGDSLGIVLRSPSFFVGLGIVVLPGVVAVAVKFLRPLFGGAPVRWASVLRTAGGGAVIGLLVLTSAFFRQTDCRAPDIWVLAILSFVVLGVYALERLLSRPQLLHLTAWGLLAALFVALFLPMALRWPTVELVVYPKSQVRYLTYLLLESRLTWLPIVLSALFVASFLLPQTLAFCRSFRPVDRLAIRLGPWNPTQWPLQIERHAVAVTIVLVLAVGFGAYYAVQLLPGFSREVSQKHILELYYGAEERSDLGEDIFKYQGSGNDPEDRNFYTAQIPALTSQGDLTAVLLGKEDALLKVTRSSSHPGPGNVLLRGFDPANDKDGDGQRDHASDAGLATAVADDRLVDESKNWEPDQWKGYQLYDWRGNAYDVMGNDATSLQLSLTPPVHAGRADSMRYVIDRADAANHGASGNSLERYYVILSQEAFSSVNFSFRAKSEGMHIPVLDGSNVNFLLAASHMLPGEKNHNRFANATIAQDRFGRLLEWSAAERGAGAEDFGVDEELAPHGRLRSGYINFNDQVKFQGYQMKSTSVARGEKLNLRLFFECTGKVTTSWKIFIHMDSTGASNRIHGDHWPLNLVNDPEDKKCSGCWRTNHWMKGDIVLDDYQTEVPLGSPSGIYNIYMGFYTPGSDKRLKVKDYDRKRIRHDGKDRVFIGTFEVH